MTVLHWSINDNIYYESFKYLADKIDNLNIILSEGPLICSDKLGDLIVSDAHIRAEKRKILPYASILSVAAYSGKIKAVEYFLRKGIDVNIDLTQSYTSPLISAIEGFGIHGRSLNKQFKILNLLLDKGADINSVTKIKNQGCFEDLSGTALIAAVKTNN